MVTIEELLTRVEAAFEITGRRLAPWPDPHPDRSPLDEEYSRLLDPAKYRIIGARADAWFAALAECHLATVEHDVTVAWANEPGTNITRTDRIVPIADGALSIVVARSRLGDAVDAGVVFGVGDPSVRVALIPDCGCDACDSGSRNELDQFDLHLLAVATGTFRRLSRRGCQITVLEEGGWSAQGSYGRRFRRGRTRDEVARILADPTGWDELTGVSWFAEQ